MSSAKSVDFQITLKNLDLNSPLSVSGIVKLHSGFDWPVCFLFNLTFQLTPTTQPSSNTARWASFCGAPHLTHLKSNSSFSRRRPTDRRRLVVQIPKMDLPTTTLLRAQEFTPAHVSLPSVRTPKDRKMSRRGPYHDQASTLI